MVTSTEEPSSVWRIVYVVGFLFLTPSLLYFDSDAAEAVFGNVRPWLNVIAMLYVFFMYWNADKELRKLMLVMVPLSYLGEYIFCGWLGWYTYRGGDIPLYVPFGHAIVYGSGYLIAGMNIVKDNKETFGKIFPVVFSLLFAGVCFLLNDWFTFLSGLLFFGLIYRKKRHYNLYYCIALCVIYIELWGTYFGCWKWSPFISGVLPTANPPLGAVFFYGGGDVLLAKIVRSKQTEQLAETI